MDKEIQNTGKSLTKKNNNTMIILIVISIFLLFILLFKMQLLNKNASTKQFSEGDLLLVNKIYKFFKESDPDYYTYSDFLASANNTYTNLLSNETFYILKAKSQSNTLTKDYIKSQLYSYK